ncbi:hypothetical protein OFC13_28600, partial [Escherichia coli]|nr:hypothetical protein [Escherichia coli]
RKIRFVDPRIVPLGYPHVYSAKVPCRCGGGVLNLEVHATYFPDDRCDGDTPCAACVATENDCTYGSEANS